MGEAGRGAAGERIPVRHDRLFKEFLHRFLPQFVTLFFPKQAAQLDSSTLHFLDKELVVNLPVQALRIPDVVAEVQTLDGEIETIIVHVEVEARERRTLPRRMFEYYGLLRLLRQRRVLPLALLLTPSSDGLLWQDYRESLLGEELLHFRYGEVGVRELASEAYLRRNEPVAAALAALMKPAETETAVIKLESLRQVLESALPENDRSFLAWLVNTYLPQAQVSATEEHIMQELELMVDSAVYHARYEALEEGREEGRYEGEQRSLLRMLRLRFGELPQPLVDKINSLDDLSAFAQLMERGLLASSISDVERSLDSSESNGTTHAGSL